jgi:sulfur relay (sulfurtransferase) DsrF/TusC family protein
VIKMKKLVITYTHPPYGTSHFMEGLRLASGMGFDEHEAKLVFLGEGAFCALKGVDKAPAEQFLETIAEFDYPLYVERESLYEHGINEAHLDPDAKVVLIEAGVYLDVTSLKGKAKLFALKRDVEKRGLSGRLEGVEL